MKISRFDRRLNSPRFQDWCTLCESGGQSNRDTIQCSQLLPAIRKHSFPLQNSISRYYYILLSFSRTTPPPRWIKPWSTSGGGDERSSRRWKQRSVGILRGVSLRRDPKLKAVFPARCFRSKRRTKEAPAIFVVATPLFGASGGGVALGMPGHVISLPCSAHQKSSDTFATESRFLDRFATPGLSSPLLFFPQTRREMSAEELRGISRVKRELLKNIGSKELAWRVT